MKGNKEGNEKSRVEGIGKEKKEGRKRKIRGGRGENKGQGKGKKGKREGMKLKEIE